MYHVFFRQLNLFSFLFYKRFYCFFFSFKSHLIIFYGIIISFSCLRNKKERKKTVFKLEISEAKYIDMKLSFLISHFYFNNNWKNQLGVPISKSSCISQTYIIQQISITANSITTKNLATAKFDKYPFQLALTPMY